MKNVVLTLFLAILVLAGGASPANVIKVKRDFGPSFVGYAQDRCVVVFKQGTTADDQALAAIARDFQVGRFDREFPTAKASKPVDEPLTRHYKAHFPEGNLEKVMEAYRRLPFVERVEPVGIYRMSATPNDYYYEGGSPTFPYDQWHYWDTYGINADSAWDVETGDPNVIVAVIDGGVRYTHYELGGTNPPGPNDNSTNGNIWVNDGEIPSNGIDDDNNGYVDDVVGWDFVASASLCNDADCSTPDNDPMDGMGHGTHVAGTIAAITNNDPTWGVAGIAGGWNDGTTDFTSNGVKIMCLRVGWRSPLGGYVGMDYVSEALYYVATMVDKGYNITAVNCSWGSSSLIAAAVNAVKARDVQLVVAAGNANSSSADYLGSRGDCIDVGATDQSGNPASFSNYGNWVDVAAPGVEILSTYHNPDDPANDYIALMDGTSMSCPHVTAVVGLLESYNPALTRQEKYDIITNPANMKPYSMTKNVGPGIVDARRCLDAAGGGCDVAADFSGTPTSGCAPLTVTFADLSTGSGIDSWSWTFGDGGSSNAQNPSHQYTNPGTYTVMLTASSSSQGCNDSNTKTGYITVNGGPVADFQGSPTSGTEPLTVNFTDLSIGATGWSWDFGDGGGSTSQNPSHTYSAGTYTVTLTATNACGSDIAQKIDYITVSPCVAPVADFSGSPTTGCAPLTVNFSDLSTGNPTSWDWTFGDGGSSTAQNPSHTYSDAGCYTVTLTVANGCGSDAASMVDYICADPCGPRHAYAQSDMPVIGTVSGSFTNTLASDNVYETITETLYTGHPKKRYSYLEHRWMIDVGDGGSGMAFYVEAYRPNNTDGDDFVFSYSVDNVTFTDMITVASAAEQVYSASLPAGLTGAVYIRVLDTDRSWGNLSLDPVYIDEMYVEFSSQPGPPTADFVGAPTSGLTPLTVQFTDLSTGNPTGWSWDFGDGVGTSTAQNPSYTYTNAGTYTVSLTATNTYGYDTQTKIGYITVSEPGQNFSHVADMAVGTVRTGANSRGTCTVTIFDQANVPLADATVYVSYDGPNSGNLSGVTAADGTIYFETLPFKKPATEWCFEVTDVTHATHTYDPAANNVTRSCESGPVYTLARSSGVPTEFSLSSRPNPFNPVATIEFTLPKESYVRLDIFNILGQRVTTLADGHFSAGWYSYEWNASNVASGIYLYRLTTDEFSQTKRMLLMK